jgi:RNA-directed DNA polymerase
MFLACERVVRNGGVAGADGMTVKELEPCLIGRYRELCESIEGGWHKAQPVRRVEIPKPDGGARLLGVPMVLDRMVRQLRCRKQAMAQVLQPVFEPTFSDSRLQAEMECAVGDRTGQRILRGRVYLGGRPGLGKVL